MTDRKKKYYYDILSAIALIDEFLTGTTLFAQYITDKKTKSAVERQLAIIGEAITQIKKIDRNEIITDHSKIIAFRNLLIHSYDNVDDRQVWAIVTSQLQPLKEEVKAKLNT